MKPNYAKMYHDLLRDVARYVSSPTWSRDLSDLEEWAREYEPSEAEQGLTPIPVGYAEQ